MILQLVFLCEVVQECHKMTKNGQPTTVFEFVHDACAPVAIVFLRFCSGATVTMTRSRASDLSLGFTSREYTNVVYVRYGIYRSEYDSHVPITEREKGKPFLSLPYHTFLNVSRTYKINAVDVDGTVVTLDAQEACYQSTSLSNCRFLSSTAQSVLLPGRNVFDDQTKEERIKHMALYLPIA